MATILDNLQAVKSRIAEAARAAGRDVNSITLLAVSKTHAATAIREAHAAGQRAFGENYVQEAVHKMDALRDLTLEWHLIGPLQANKTRLAAERFSWIHTIEREKIAQRLAEQRPRHLPPLNVMIQVNVSGEASKSGVAPQALTGLAHNVARLPNLRLRGLMAIPEPSEDPGVQRARFHEVFELLEALKHDGLALDTLSMGMSADMEAAIAEGSTLVRIGTAIFGARARQRSAA